MAWGRGEGLGGHRDLKDMDFIRATLHHNIHGCNGEVDFPAYRVEHDKAHSHL